ncbi:MAG: hypothetical protein KBS64_00985 [Treponema sp.]|nr:hypothetical protein [Candidatus Treponema equi]
MKGLFVFAAFCLMFSSAVVAENKDTIWYEYSRSDTRTVSSDCVAIASYFTREAENYDCSFGIQFAADQITFDVEGIWTFGQWGKFDLCARGISSIEKFSDISWRTNNFTGLNVRYNFAKNWYASTDFLVGFRSVDYIGLDMDAKFKGDLMMGFLLSWKDEEGRQASFSVSTRDRFFYPNFGYLVYALSYRHDYDSDISLSATLSMRGIDMMTLSSYVDGWALKVAMGIRL